MKKIKAMHLIRQKDIKEEIQSPFDSVKEGAIDSDNHIVKGVCIFGTRESANNRVYQDKAISSLCKLANGAKMYLNHPGKSELKEHSGVRRIQDWGGVFENTRQEKDKIFADLRVREAYWDLVHDVATMSPANVGHSINARVKIFSDEQGKESVVDVDKLSSIDLVSSAATTTSLFESIQENMNECGDSEILLSMVEARIQDKFQLAMMKEGVLQDKINEDKIKREMSDVNWTAISMIEDCLFERNGYKDKKMSMGDKKKEVTTILDDLDKEIQKRVAKVKGEMKEMEITVDVLKKDYPRIVEALLNESKSKAEYDTVQEQAKKLAEMKTTLEAQIVGKDAEIKTLKEQNQAMAVELDKMKVTEKLSAKKALIDKLLAESKLPKEAKTDLFISQLMSLEEKKNGDKVITVEEQAKGLIEDRQKVVAVASGKVTGMGDEHTQEATESDKMKTKKTVEEATSDFLKRVK